MTEEKMEALVAISTYLMFGSKRALIRLQIAAWHHRKKRRRPQIAAWYHQKGIRTLPKARAGIGVEKK